MTLNLRKRRGRDRRSEEEGGEGVSQALKAFSGEESGESSSHLLVLLKMKNARASGMGTAFSFSWMSESGRGLGPTGISGSSSSSSPGGRREEGDE